MTNRRLATIGVLLGIFLAAVDGTIVSTAMPTVVSALGGLEYYSWAFAAYMLFAAVSMPLHGRLADIYGRKRLFYAGVVLFVVGSALAGFATSMPQLIAFRCLQGVGAGAMFAIPYTILGIIYPPEQRGEAIGLGSAVWGVSSVIGPVLGAAIVETVGWQWVFWVSVPFGIAAIALVAASLDESTGDATPDLDVLGAAVLTLGVGTLLVGLQFLESDVAIAPVLVAIGLVGVVAFVFVERRATQPIVPISLFADRTFSATNATGFLSSFALFAALTYVPLYVQSVGGGPASAAIAVFPISLGWSGTSVIAGRIVARVGERRLVALGTVFLVASFAVATATWTATTPTWQIVVNVFFMGVGMGAQTPALLTAVQNRFGDAQMGVVTSSQQFFRNLGGTMGVALLGFLLNVTLRDQLRSFPNISSMGDLQQSLLGSGSPPAGLATVLTTGITYVFVACVVVSLLAVGTAYFVPGHAIPRSTPTAADD